METNKEGDVTLSVVMPAYNEGTHITDNLLETSRVLSLSLIHISEPTRRS